MLLTFLNTLYRVGLDFAVEEDAIRFFGGDEPPRPIALETDVHPGFMTDWQQPFTVLLTQAHGMSVIHETIYEDRFGYTQDLNRMGADTGLFPKCLGELPCRFREMQYLHSCVVRGPTPLHAAELTMPDIRAGAAYILAALCAHGVSRCMASNTSSAATIISTSSSAPSAHAYSAFQLRGSRWVGCVLCCFRNYQGQRSTGG